MKKLKLLILVLFTLSINAFTQIELEHSFESVNTYPVVFYTEKGIQYALADLENNKVIIYNSDYSVYKLVEVSFSDSVELKTVALPSDKLFNTDNQIELIAVGAKGSEYEMQIINENGQLIRHLGNGMSASISSTKEVTKLNIYHSDYNPETKESNTTLDVYSLPGKPNSNNVIMMKTNNVHAFPNPTNGILTIPYRLQEGKSSTMNFYNTSGSLILKKPINSTDNKVIFNTNTLSKGVYFYEYNGVKKRFVVQ